MLNPRTCKALELLIKLSALVFFYDYLYLEARSFACLPSCGVLFHVNKILVKMHLFSLVPQFSMEFVNLFAFGCFGATRSEHMG